MCTLIHHPKAILHTPTGCPPWYNPGKNRELTTSLNTSSLQCCSRRNWTREESPFPELCPGIKHQNTVLHCKPGSCLAIPNVLCKPSPLLRQQDYYHICHQRNTYHKVYPKLLPPNMTAMQKPLNSPNTTQPSQRIQPTLLAPEQFSSRWFVFFTVLKQFF